MVSRKLTTSANDSDKTEYESENPARAATESMTAADDGCDDYRGEVDDEFEDGNASSRVELRHESLVLMLLT
jgi:hypothetical protein